METGADPVSADGQFEYVEGIVRAQLTVACSEAEPERSREEKAPAALTPAPTLSPRLSDEHNG